MDKSPRDKWKECLGIIRNNLDEQRFNTWFEPIRFKSYDQDRKELTIFVPSSFFYEYLEGHYRRIMHMTIAKVFGADQHLKYEVKVAGKETVNVESDEPTLLDRQPRAAVPANQSPRMAQAAGAPQDLDSCLNMKQNFGNFIEGVSNKLPRSIGLSIAENPSQQTFNPLFIYGPSGVGKTHLVNAIGTRMKELHPDKRVLYLSARLFEVQYTSSVRQNRINDFMHFYQSIDMLIVDDIQEMVGKQATQYTFFHIFNHLFRNNKRIILAADRPPVELQGMMDRLLTRFKCGLIAPLERPNTQLCMDILKKHINHEHLKIPQDVVEFIARNANGSVRDLQGVLNMLEAFSMVYKRDVDMSVAQKAVKTSVKIEEKPLEVDEIIDAVCTHFNVTTSDVNSRSRKREYVMARQVSMYLAQKHTKMPASRIGKMVGGRDHSTVIHSCAQVERRLKVDSKFSDEILSIENSFRLKAV